MSPIPGLVLLSFWRPVHGLSRGDTYSPYLWSVAPFLLGYIGLLSSLYPYMVPYSLTFQQAAAAPITHRFLLVGALVMPSVTLAYTGYVYWVFRGKVTADTGYH